jgi:hypothetical protein
MFNVLLHMHNTQRHTPFTFSGYPVKRYCGICMSSTVAKSIYYLMVVATRTNIFTPSNTSYQKGKRMFMRLALRNFDLSLSRPWRGYLLSKAVGQSVKVNLIEELEL